MKTFMIPSTDWFQRLVKKIIKKVLKEILSTVCRLSDMDINSGIGSYYRDPLKSSEKAFRRLPHIETSEK